MADKLQEERVRRVVEPLLSGRGVAETVPDDDLQYTRDLGLVRREGPGHCQSNLSRNHPSGADLYDPRERSITIRLGISGSRSDCCRREHSEHWVERFKEAGPQLLLQASGSSTAAVGLSGNGLGRGRTVLIVWRQGAQTRW